MNDQERRQFLAHGAMGLAACIGAYMALVDGPRKQLADARAQRAALAAQVHSAESLRDQVPTMTAALDKVSREAEEIRDMGRLAREERGLFAALMSLAGAHHVRLDELNPARPASGSQRMPPGQTAAPRSPDAVIGYSMTAIAPYDDLAAFAASVRAELGYSVIRSIRLTPVQNERVRLVRALIETEHYAFDTSPPAAPDAGVH